MRHFWRRLKDKNGKAGFPKFKKKGYSDSFRYPQYVRCESSKVFLPKIGWVAYRDSRPIEGSIKQATIKREGKHWIVCIMCEVEKEIPSVEVIPEKVAGIDLGLSTFAYLSTGQKIENPTFLKKGLDKLRKLQRKCSRAKKGSKSRSKLGKKVAKLHCKVKNKRKDFLHKITTSLVENQNVLVVENLNIKGMIKNRKRSRAIADVGWHQFCSLLKYKCEWAGKQFVQIDRFLPTSKECSSCHDKQDMPLCVRRYLCKSCGLDIDRDYNASKNIRTAGLSVLNAYGGNGIGLPHEVRIHGLQAV